MSEINVGAISEALNSKIDLPTPSTPQDAVDYVIEMQRPTADNNYTWYRKYKSGWVEQGGKVTLNGSNKLVVQLPVTMANTDYHVSAIAVRALSGSYGIYETSNSSTQFSLHITIGDSSETPANWKAEGLSAA